MESLTLRIHSTALRAALGRLCRQLHDLSPVLRAQTERLAQAAALAFARRADPSTGVPWKARQTTHGGPHHAQDGGGGQTQPPRSAAGKLRASGLLENSITHADAAGSVRKISPHHALIGSSVPYAGIQQCGGKTRPHDIRPRHAKALYLAGIGFRRKVSHPGSVLPARPFLGAGPQDKAAMLDMLLRQLTRCVMRAGVADATGTGSAGSGGNGGTAGL